MISSTRKVRFVRRPDKAWAIVEASSNSAAAAGRVPRISRLMALAIHFDRLLREGKVRDQSELARLSHITQPRMTQIMNLNHLAPGIQQELLFLQAIMEGRSRIHEKALRSVATEPDWRKQRAIWRQLRGLRPEEIAAQHPTLAVAETTKL